LPPRFVSPSFFLGATVLSGTEFNWLTVEDVRDIVAVWPRGLNGTAISLLRQVGPEWRGYVDAMPLTDPFVIAEGASDAED
jgi:hypothetical protein